MPRLRKHSIAASPAARGFGLGLLLGALLATYPAFVPQTEGGAGGNAERMTGRVGKNLLIGSGTLDWYAPAVPGEHELTLVLQRLAVAVPSEIFQPADLGWRPIEYDAEGMARIEGRVRTRLPGELLHAEIREIETGAPARGIFVRSLEMRLAR